MRRRRKQVVSGRKQPSRRCRSVSETDRPDAHDTRPVLTRAAGQTMAKAAAKGIPLGDYIKFHAPEPLVRAQLDGEELRYTWIDINGNARASDDGGELPPKGWWRRLEITKIDRETSEVRGNALFGPTFPMYFVK